MSELRKALRKAKMTQADLARHLKISPQVVNNWTKRGLPPEWARNVGSRLNYDHRKLCPDFPWPK